MARSSVSPGSSARRVLRTVGLSLLALLLAAGGAAGDQARSSALSRAERDFLERHWTRPIAPQGSPPGRFSNRDCSCFKLSGSSAKGAPLRNAPGLRCTTAR